MSPALRAALDELARARAEDVAAEAAFERSQEPFAGMYGTCRTPRPADVANARRARDRATAAHEALVDAAARVADAYVRGLVAAHTDAEVA